MKMYVLGTFYTFQANNIHANGATQKNIQPYFRCYLNHSSQRQSGSSLSHKRQQRRRSLSRLNSLCRGQYTQNLLFRKRTDANKLTYSTSKILLTSKVKQITM